MFWNNLEWFIYGAVFGYFWNPVWRIAKKIVEEAQIARKEWHNPIDKDR
jgi:hypothetical protein